MQGSREWYNALHLDIAEPSLDNASYPEIPRILKMVPLVLCY